MAEAEEVVVPEPKKRSKLSLLLIIAAAILLLGGGGFLAFKYLGARKVASANGKSGGKATNPMERVKSVMNLDAFLVNLADEEATRFLKITLRLGLDEAKAGEEYAGNPVLLAATRDRIISLLSTKTSEEILTSEGKESLRKEIREKVNEVLPKAKIVEVFIMDFVVQL